MIETGAVAALAALALAVSGCGGGAPKQTRTTKSSATVSGKRVGQLDRADVRCGNQQFYSTATTTSSVCASVSSAESAIRVITCGAGLTTNTSCYFAHNVQDGYAAAEAATGKPPATFVVPRSGTPPNPVLCSGVASRWRCESERNAAVWVRYGKP